MGPSTRGKDSINELNTKDISTEKVSPFFYLHPSKQVAYRSAQQSFK